MHNVSIWQENERSRHWSLLCPGYQSLPDGGTESDNWAGKLLKAMEEEIRKNGFSVIRMDTHRDNVPMQTWLGSHGFVHCGTIFLGRTDETRMAFEKALSLEK